MSVSGTKLQAILIGLLLLCASCIASEPHEPAPQPTKFGGTYVVDNTGTCFYRYSFPVYPVSTAQMLTGVTCSEAVMKAAGCKPNVKLTGDAWDCP